MYITLNFHICLKILKLYNNYIINYNELMYDYIHIRINIIIMFTLIHKVYLKFVPILEIYNIYNVNYRNAQP